MLPSVGTPSPKPSDVTSCVSNTLPSPPILRRLEEKMKLFSGSLVRLVGFPETLKASSQNDLVSLRNSRAPALRSLMGKIGSVLFCVGGGGLL